MVQSNGQRMALVEKVIDILNERNNLLKAPVNTQQLGSLTVQCKASITQLGTDYNELGIIQHDIQKVG